MSAVSIHMVLHDLAQADPARPALIHGDEVVSRGQLDAWSDAVAEWLAAEGVRAGSIVPLQLETSSELIAAALGVLKLGAAYTVMDLAWNERRLRRIDEILGGALAVAAPGGSSGCFRREIELPGFDTPSEDSADRAWKSIPVAGTDIATVFFTSGSTGEPKAVLSTHEATLRMFTGEGIASIDEETVLAHLGSSNWDAFPFEVWGPLLRGGASLLRKHRALTPDELRHEIVDHGLNTLFVTSSLFNVLVDEDVSAFEGLRVAMAGGEALSPAHVARFLAAHPDIPFINGYGPAESTCIALMHRVTLDDTRGAIPLGRPIPRTGVHVLDGERECGPDEIGELCISGDGVSPGYLGDEALTAAKFTEVLVGGRRLRVYRTGDYGSRTASGVFTYAGRRDRELKIRGHRIDAGQIERTAAAFDGVARCAVVPLLGLSGRPESLALAVVSASDHFDEESLRTALAADLPPGWAPDAVVRLAALPLTSNAKLDTVALHSAIVELTAARAAANPSDPIEAAFSRALGGTSVDPDASLFDLGGTSLGAVRLCTALSQVTGLSIPVSVVRSHPSVNEMRVWIAKQSAATPDGANGTDAADSADRADAAAPAPLTGMQSGFLLQHLDGNDTDNHLYLAWRIAGALDIDRFVEALQDVHRRHLFLQGRYAFEDLATWNRSDRPVTVEHIDAPDEETALPQLRAVLDRSFSLFEGEVWRAVLCKLGEPERWIFGMSVHHIAFDGWSKRIFVEDLAEAYRARCDGREPRFAHPVAAPSEIYAETERIRGLADLEAQRDYWAKELAELPVDPAPWVTPALCTEAGVTKIDVPLMPEQADSLGRRSIGGGLLPLFIAALGGTLSEVTGAEDVTIGIPISQRSTPVLQDTIACLINMMGVRLRTTTAHDAAARAESAVLTALRNNDLSIAEAARIAGQAGQQLYHVIGAVQDSPSAELQLDGCAVHGIELPYIRLQAPLLVELLADDGIASTVRVTYETALVTESTARNISARLVARLTEESGSRSGSGGPGGA
ncbi:MULTISPECIES: AMP-binding protein [unclassified Streptomyces]|uniref:AMP-binding protein n=1 Tax=unclassified Streptomyces TaxID=2593676 RepID=UPI002366D1E6|nr:MULTISPECIES: AMP-binding protein [unclassified Streptomyces]MDF3140217.1 AMP-binding protein [Streptomyces sp. T21Q-yed]WDF38209.1 AMP-binding protein [Streptomyces sp. T12]